jgi:hypothetical protein
LIGVLFQLKSGLTSAPRLPQAETRDGSLFDLANDSAPDIAKVIVAKLTPHKASNIARLIVEGVKAKKTPAG